MDESLTGTTTLGRNNDNKNIRLSELEPQHKMQLSAPSGTHLFWGGGVLTPQRAQSA